MPIYNQILAIMYIGHTKHFIDFRECYFHDFIVEGEKCDKHYSDFSDQQIVLQIVRKKKRITSSFKQNPQNSNEFNSFATYIMAYMW